MMNRPHALRSCLVPVLLVAGALFGGCGSPPPDTSPEVTITSPFSNALLPAGQAIMVGFQVSGLDKDPATGKSVAFTLDPLSGWPDGVKTIGKGVVVAYYNGNSSLGVAANPADLTILVPSAAEGYGDPSTIIKPGSGDLQLWLQYGDGTPVNPQRHADVTVSIYSP